MTLKFDVFPYTITNKRADNQDTLWYGIYETPISHEQGILALVSDGMGGLQKGAVASQAVGKLYDEFFRTAKMLDNDTLVSLVLQSHRVICEIGNSGATLSLLRACKGKYFIAHLGDSRVYRIPAQGGSAIQLTADHSAISEAKQKGIELTPELIQAYAGKITRGLGMPSEPSVATYKGTYNEGDCFLLCSDGFWHHFEKCDGMLSSLSLEGIEKLSADAIDFGETDNISALLIKA